jgi:cold shock CspA family protein
MKTIYATEYTYLYPNGSIEKIVQKYTSCEGPIEDYIGYDTVITGNLKAEYDLNVVINHRVTVPSFRAEVRWFDNTSGEGMVRLDNGESVWMHISTLDPKALYYPVEGTPKLNSGDRLVVTIFNNECIGSARFDASHNPIDLIDGV